MPDIQVTGIITVDDTEVDRDDRSGLTAEAFDEYITPLIVNYALDNVETELLP